MASMPRESEILFPPGARRPSPTYPTTEYPYGMYNGLQTPYSHDRVYGPAPFAASPEQHQQQQQHYGYVTPSQVYRELVLPHGLQSAIQSSPTYSAYYDYSPPHRDCYAGSESGQYPEYPDPRQTPPQNPQSSPERKPVPVSPEDISKADKDNAPYAQLIYRALMSSENHMMSLQQIYEWVAKNSNKVQDRTCKGWQNSIRHNLSMNAAFESIKGIDADGKPTSVWVLTEEAITNGILSTTRYRKPLGIAAAKSPSPRRRKGVTKRGNAPTRRSARKPDTNHYELTVADTKVDDGQDDAPSSLPPDHGSYMNGNFASYGEAMPYATTPCPPNFSPQMSPGSAYPDFTPSGLPRREARPYLVPFLEHYPTPLRMPQPSPPQFDPWHAHRRMH
ncbi:hypothetical protein KEM56_007215 [Ascosphaera pollenicola]|nr:hypothetical protein KEM56_007215 [Ascosphaera pollenicola]